MFRQIYFGLKNTKNTNTNEYKLLTGAYLAPDNIFKLLIIKYIKFVLDGLKKFEKNHKNDINE